MKKEKEKLFQPKAIKDVAVGMLYYNATSILGPILVFAGGGLLLDNYLNTKPYLTISGLIIAFIISNLLILKKVNKLTGELKQYHKKQKNKGIEERKSEETKEEKIINKEHNL